MGHEVNHPTSVYNKVYRHVSGQIKARAILPMFMSSTPSDERWTKPDAFTAMEVTCRLPLDRRIELFSMALVAEPYIHVNENGVKYRCWHMKSTFTIKPATLSLHESRLVHHTLGDLLLLMDTAIAVWQRHWPIGLRA